MLNGLNTDNDEKLIKYTNVEYGSNVKFREVNGVKIIDVPRMRHSCVMIATPKNDCTIQCCYIVKMCERVDDDFLEKLL